MFVKLFNKLTSICETILAVVPCEASSQVVRGSISQQHTIARHAWADTRKRKELFPLCDAYHTAPARALLLLKYLCTRYAA